MKTNNYFNNVSSNLNFNFSLFFWCDWGEGGEALSCQPEDRGSNTEFKLTSFRITKTREAIGQLVPRLSGRPS